MHDRERRRLEIGELADRRRQRRRQTGGQEHLLTLHRGPDDVTFGDRGTVTRVLPDVAAQQGVRRLLVQHPRFPVVRDVPSVEVPHSLAAEIDHLAVGKLSGWPIGHVVDRDEAAGDAVRDLGVRRGGQPFVHRTALVRFDVTERDPAQRLQGDDLCRCLGDERKHLTRAAMEQQRLVGVHDELVEGEATRGDLGHVRGQAVDPVRNLIDLRLHHSCSSVVNLPRH